MILDEIVAHKHQEIASAKAKLPLSELEERTSTRKMDRDFYAALHHPGEIRLIAELKRMSPSKGMLRERFDPVALAQTMQDAGAHALSVLTDERFFGGSLEFLRDAKQFTELPALRKDFILDPYQIHEAAFHGADAVLLIVRILTPVQLREYRQLAERLGLAALVEVHTEAEMEVALKTGVRIVGINHRDLQTFNIDMDLSARLAPMAPKGTLLIAESGIHTPEDVARLRGLGVHALLIGESLMTAPDVGAKIRELLKHS